jgi:AcrR family transcriptional regulator
MGVLDAALRCVARWGLTKTTLDDVAKEAGCSRATVYRAFPGGKDALFEAVGERELTALFGAVAEAIHAAADDEEAARTVEWVARIVLSYLCTPAAGMQLTDDVAVRKLVRSFVLPGLLQPTA